MARNAKCSTGSKPCGSGRSGRSVGDCTSGGGGGAGVIADVRPALSPYKDVREHKPAHAVRYEEALAYMVVDDNCATSAGSEKASSIAYSPREEHGAGGLAIDSLYAEETIVQVGAGRGQECCLKSNTVSMRMVRVGRGIVWRGK